MRRWPVTLHGKSFEVVQHDDGTFELPPELAALKGRNTALKPGQEIWWLARKPLNGTVAANVLEHGTGALNIDACRIGGGQDYRDKCASVVGLGSNRNGDAYGEWTGERADSAHPSGRWPPNLVLTHSAACEPADTREVRSDGHHPAARGPGGLGTSGHAGQEGLDERKSGTETVQAWHCAPDCPVGELDRQSGVLSNCGGPKRTTHDSGMFGIGQPGTVYADHGGASRFYPVFRYQAKAPASERPRGEDGNAHPTVKAVPLLRYFARLICPPGGTILDLFAGSGSMAEACIIEGFKCILIEKERPSAELIRIRLRKDIQPVMFGEVS
jgi:hypothetical protein